MKREGTKAAYVEASSSPIPGLTKEQYESFLSTFTGDKANQIRNEPTRMVNFAGNKESNDDWVVDSGATEHITYDPDFLDNKIKSELEVPVTIANGTKVPVKGKGSGILKGGTKIDKVLYVPDLNYNLLSIGKLANDLKCVVSFFPDFYVMQKLHMKSLIGAGRYEQGLYRMGMIRNERKAMMVTNNTWHKRLGHASSDKPNKESITMTLLLRLPNSLQLEPFWQWLPKGTGLSTNST